MVYHFSHFRCEGLSLGLHEHRNRINHTQSWVVFILKRNEYTEEDKCCFDYTTINLKSTARSRLHQLNVKLSFCVFLRGFVHTVPVFWRKGLGNGPAHSRSGKSKACTDLNHFGVVWIPQAGIKVHSSEKVERAHVTLLTLVGPNWNISSTTRWIFVQLSIKPIERLITTLMILSLHLMP